MKKMLLYSQQIRSFGAILYFTFIACQFGYKPLRLKISKDFVVLFFMFFFYYFMYFLSFVLLSFLLPNKTKYESDQMFLAMQF